MPAAVGLSSLHYDMLTSGSHRRDQEPLLPIRLNDVLLDGLVRRD